MVDGQLFSGDDRAIAMLREGNQWYSQYLQMVRPRTGDQTGRFISQIIEGNKTPEHVASWLYGANLTRPTGQSVAAARRIRDIVGAESEEWSAVRGATFLRLMSSSDNVDDILTPGRIANNITGFVSGRGSGLAAAMFSAEERDLMRRFANTLRMLIPDTAATNPSRTAANVMRALTPYAQGLSVMLGFTIAGWPSALTALIGQPMVKVAATRVAVSRALNPNAAQPFLQNPLSASRALAAVLGAANILTTPRLAQ